MARRGRPRKYIREDDPRTHVARQRAQRLGVTLTPQNFNAMLDPRQGYALGRLFMAEEASTGTGVDKDQHRAGIWSLSAYTAYCRRVLGKWPHPRIQELDILPEVIEAREDDPGFQYDPTLDETELARRITDRYMLAEGAALAAGRAAWLEFRSVVYDDHDCRDLTGLRAALDSVFREAKLG